LARANSKHSIAKEFIVDEYQILEAKKPMYADLILLIAAVLTREEIKQLSEFAHKLD
jgi:indole-3-glycerol phosphate synthase